MKNLNRVAIFCGLFALGLVAFADYLWAFDDGVNGKLMGFLGAWLPEPQGVASTIGPTRAHVTESIAIVGMRIVSAILAVLGSAIAIVSRIRGELGGTNAGAAALCLGAMMWQVAF